MPALRPLTGLAITALTLGLLAGCHHYPPPPPPDGHVLPPMANVPARDVFSLEVAERICGIDSLTSQYQDMQRQVRDMQVPGPGYPFGTGGGHTTHDESTSNRTVTRPVPGPQTAQVEMLRTLELDVDASYRFATSACQAYAVCMYQRSYQEGACQDPRREWTAAQERFDGLSARISQTRVDLANSTRLTGPGGHHRPPAPVREGCRDQLGGFTTAGCQP